MLPHLGQFRITPIAATLRTASRRPQVTHSIVNNRGSSTVPSTGAGDEAAHLANLRAQPALSIVDPCCVPPPASGRGI